MLAMLLKLVLVELSSCGFEREKGKEKRDMSIPTKKTAGMTKRRNRIRMAAIFRAGLDGGSCGGVLNDSGRAGSINRV